MKKPLSNIKANKGSCENIIRQSLVIKQVIKHSRHQALTDCLTIIENSGYTGDTAIFILSQAIKIYREGVKDA